MVRLADDLLAAHRAVVGHVEEVAVPLAEAALAALFDDRLLDDDNPIRVPGLVRSMVEVGHVLALEP